MPRKTDLLPLPLLLDGLASMRPRPDAAENFGQGRLNLSGEVCASMRPRPDAAENRRGRRRAGVDVLALQ